jgi:NDP-sugar pyrophosphorylase family protein
MRAIVLAGGRGERLRPYTNDRPKPMVELKGYPILAYQLSWLQEYGVGEIVISCGYLHHVIEAYFGDGSVYGLDIKYAVEEKALGRGGGIKAAFAFLDPAHADEPVVVTNGDIITDLDLTTMVEAHTAKGVLASVYLTPLYSPYGIANVDPEGYVVEFREKPELPYWINGGVYVFSPGTYPYLPDVGDLEDSTFPQLSTARQLAGHLSRAYWRAVDTAKDLSEISRELDARPLACLGPATGG